ncbi:hypothetical protein M445_12190 [Vibrio owensii 47666-1]|uniref:EAL domain-containing protein n=1 Tax=Vibrio owensii TaxID=696485 RepID=UPI000584FEF0|nr:EAL domain-containing protein [Vibrio owensii]KIF47741.1 hypothetical protein M445_12190 [Vibrio owensii 47666-1]
MNVEGYYQPKVKPGFGVVSYEALIRSRDLKNTEEFVLQQNDKEKFDINVINFFANLLSADILRVSTAINVFSNSFYTDRFIRTCEDHCKKFNFSLEVIEYEPVLDLNRAREAMKHLSLLGIEFSLDDFGKGNSNLKMLEQLPFNEVKLDKSLVNQAMFSQKTREHLKALKSTARDLGVQQIVYEGIENQDMENMVLELDPTAILQGYFYAKPKPFLDLIDCFYN